MEFRRKKAKDYNDCRAAVYRGKGIEIFPENNAENRPDKRRGGVKMLYKNIWRRTGKNVADNSAADTGYHADENEQKDIIKPRKNRRFNSYGGENSKTDGIHQKHDFFIKSVLFKKKMAYGGKEKYDGSRNRDYRVNRIPKSCRRRIPKHDITDHTAADGGYDAESNNAEYIHFFRKPDHCAGNSKGNGADDFEYKKKFFCQGNTHLFAGLCFDYNRICRTIQMIILASPERRLPY